MSNQTKDNVEKTWKFLLGRNNEDLPKLEDLCNENFILLADLSRYKIKIST